MCSNYYYNVTMLLSDEKFPLFTRVLEESTAFKSDCKENAGFCGQINLQV